MNLLITINDTYFEPAYVMMKTFVMHNPGKHRLFILHKNLSVSYIQELRQFLQGYDDSEVIDIRVDDEIYKDAPLFSFFKIEIYFRVLSHLYLPKDVERILYLDVDIVIKKSLEEFYEQDFAGKYIVAAADLGGMKEAERLGLPEEHTYFNAGVILMNLSLIRRYVDEDMVKTYFAEHGNRLRLLDQDLLNLMYVQKAGIADWKIYNHQIRGIERTGREERRTIGAETAILHYIDKQKPWHIRYENNQDIHFLKIYAERHRVKSIFLYVFHRVYSVLAALERGSIAVLKKNTLSRWLGRKIKYLLIKSNE